MDNNQEIKQELVNASQTLTHQGFLMATGGNVSILDKKKDIFAITPSNFDYLEMTPDDICILDMDLQQLEGPHKPSVEAGMHCAIYQQRPDVHTIVHTHQVYASALTLVKASIPSLFDEQVRFLGRSVEIIPYAPSGTGILSSTVAKHVRNHNNAFLMQNHGALVFGHDTDRALHNVQILEKCSLAYLLALCSEQKTHKIPLAVREIAFAKLRKDQKKAEKGVLLNE